MWEKTLKFPTLWFILTITATEISSLIDLVTCLWEPNLRNGLQSRVSHEAQTLDEENRDRHSFRSLLPPPT